MNIDFLILSHLFVCWVETNQHSMETLHGSVDHRFHSPPPPPPPSCWFTVMVPTPQLKEFITHCAGKQYSNL